MDCARIARTGVLERYLLGRLRDRDRTAFEAHYFECDRCFDELQILQTVREELTAILRSVRRALIAGLMVLTGLAGPCYSQDTTAETLEPHPQWCEVR